MNPTEINQITSLIDLYLKEKINVKKVNQFLVHENIKIRQFSKELQETIEYYNKNRKKISEIGFLINSEELNTVFNYDLPSFIQTLKKY